MSNHLQSETTFLALTSWVKLRTADQRVGARQNSDNMSLLQTSAWNRTRPLRCNGLKLNRCTSCVPINVCTTSEAADSQVQNCGWLCVCRAAVLHVGENLAELENLLEVRRREGGVVVDVWRAIAHSPPTRRVAVLHRDRGRGPPERESKGRLPAQMFRQRSGRAEFQIGACVMGQGLRTRPPKYPERSLTRATSAHTSDQAWIYRESADVSGASGRSQNQNRHGGRPFRLRLAALTSGPGNMVRGTHGI